MVHRIYRVLVVTCFPASFQGWYHYLSGGRAPPCLLVVLNKLCNKSWNLYCDANEARWPNELSLRFGSSIGCLLLFYILSTSKVISGQVLTCNIAHSLRLSSTVPLGGKDTGTMTQYPTQSYCHVTLLINGCPILISVKRRARQWQV